MSHDSGPLLIEERGAILCVTLQRPEKLNALTNEMMSRLSQATARFGAESGLKVMLISSEGRYFSAGADLIEEAPPVFTEPSEVRRFHRLGARGLSALCDEMEAIEKPIVVVHQGPCLGAGLELSLSCDFRLASSDARYGFPEGRFAVLPAANGLSRFTRLVGPHWAKLLIMAGEQVDANAALSMGLVHFVHSPETLQDEAKLFCDRLSQQDGEQMAAAKVAISITAELGLAQARNVERLANSALMTRSTFRKSAERYVARIGGEKGGD